MNKEELAKYGIDFDIGLNRCLNDEEFYKELLLMFLDDESFARAKDAKEVGDRELLFEAAHELKGVCGNTGMMDLYESVSSLVELLRHKSGTSNDIDLLFNDIEEKYIKAIDGVRYIGDEGKKDI